MNDRRHSYDLIHSKSFRRSVPGIGGKDPSIFFISVCEYVCIFVICIWVSVSIRLSTCLSTYLSSYLTAISMNSFQSVD